MANMSYCRFRNTVEDLNDCIDALGFGEIETKEEVRAAKQLIALCQEVVKYYTEEDVDDIYCGEEEE